MATSPPDLRATDFLASSAVAPVAFQTVRARWLDARVRSTCWLPLEARVRMCLSGPILRHWQGCLLLEVQEPVTFSGFPRSPVTSARAPPPSCGCGWQALLPPHHEDADLLAPSAPGVTLHCTQGRRPLSGSSPQACGQGHVTMRSQRSQSPRFWGLGHGQLWSGRSADHSPALSGAVSEAEA